MAAADRAKAEKLTQVNFVVRHGDTLFNGKIREIRDRANA
jgi:hypothetical protein